MLNGTRPDSFAVNGSVLESASSACFAAIFQAVDQRDKLVFGRHRLPRALVN